MPHALCSMLFALCTMLQALCFLLYAPCTMLYANKRLIMPQHTLLFVDDEENILKSLKRLFLSDGYTILTAPSGTEGLYMLEKNGSVDLVMSDYKMPGMKGT